MSEFRIFDVHTHAFPEKIAAKAVDKLSQSAGIPYRYDGTFDGLLNYERNGGATGFLMLPIATKAESVRSINSWVAAREGNGVLAFGAVHPECEDIESELEYILKLGLKGIKLHPEYQSFFVDEERMLPIYDAAFRRKLAICFHAGEDLGFPPPVRGDAKRIARIAKMFPEGRIIASHMGGLFQLDLVCEHLAGCENVWMDTSFAAERMSPQDIVRLIRLHGSDKFFFGTDAPWADFDTAKSAVMNAGLTDIELTDIFWNNAAKFFALKADII